MIIMGKSYQNHSSSKMYLICRHLCPGDMCNNLPRFHFEGVFTPIFILSANLFWFTRSQKTGFQSWQSLTITTHHTTTVLQPFFRDHPGEPVPEENFWTLRCKGRFTEADTPTIRLGATPSGLTSAHLHHPPYFLQAGCPSSHPTNSVKALMATALKATLTVSHSHYIPSIQIDNPELNWYHGISTACVLQLKHVTVKKC